MMSILENLPKTCTLGAKSMSLDTKQERSHPLWQNTKPLHTRGRRPLTKPRSLPAPGTVSPDRCERQCSSGGVRYQYLMARQSGTSLPFSAFRVRLREAEQLRMNVAPVYVVLGQTEWDCPTTKSRNVDSTMCVISLCVICSIYDSMS